MCRLFGALLLTPALVCAQVGWNSVTVTAARNATAQPDQAVVTVTVTSGADQGLAEILSAVEGSGLGDANFVRIQANGYTILPGAPARIAVGWIFETTVPLAQLKDVTAALSAVQQKLAQQGGGMALSFTESAGFSAPSQTCDLAGLFADARAQAQKLAGAAGLTPGALLALVSTTSASDPVPCTLTARFALGLMFGQAEPNTIGITAIRTVTVPPDQVAFLLGVGSGPAIPLDTVTAALSGAGISGATFAGVSGPPGVGLPLNSQAALNWYFTRTVPLAGIKNAFASLAAAQQAMAQANQGLSLSYSVQGSQLSPALQQAQACPQSDLLADARAQAGKVAAAADVAVGPVLNISQGSTAAPANWISANRLGNFASNLLIGGLVYSAPVPCTLNVQYQLVR